MTHSYTPTIAPLPFVARHHQLLIRDLTNMQNLCRLLVGLPLTALVLTCCQGCGLLFWPNAYQYPDPVTKVRVEDAQTGEPIAHAQVSFSFLPSSCDAFGSTYDSEIDRWNEINLKENLGTLHHVAVDTNGEMIPQREIKWGLTQFWWPLLAMNDGWIKTYFYVSVFVVTAPGFKSHMIQFTPHATELSHLQIRHDGTLVIGLRHQ